jgi:hypothetical protein
MCTVINPVLHTLCFRSVRSYRDGETSLPPSLRLSLSLSLSLSPSFSHAPRRPVIRQCRYLNILQTRGGENANKLELRWPYEEWQFFPEPAHAITVTLYVIERPLRAHATGFFTFKTVLISWHRISIWSHGACTIAGGLIGGSSRKDAENCVFRAHVPCAVKISVALNNAVRVGISFQINLGPKRNRVVTFGLFESGREICSNAKWRESD